jgi:hypothetical protein
MTRRHSSVSPLRSMTGASQSDLGLTSENPRFGPYCAPGRWPYVTLPTSCAASGNMKIANTTPILSHGQSRLGPIPAWHGVAEVARPAAQPATMFGIREVHVHDHPWLPRHSDGRTLLPRRPHDRHHLACLDSDGYTLERMDHLRSKQVVLHQGFRSDQANHSQVLRWAGHGKPRVHAHVAESRLESVSRTLVDASAQSYWTLVHATRSGACWIRPGRFPSL